MIDLFFGILLLNVSFSKVFRLKTCNSRPVALMKFTYGLMRLSAPGLWSPLVACRVIDEESFDWRRRPIALREEIVEIAHCCFFEVIIMIDFKTVVILDSNASWISFPHLLALFIDLSLGHFVLALQFGVLL